ncbi:SpoIIE family protein phosphatase [bacterium]|nr:SpoIIE family protein phosphatase [bacterium]
MILIVDDETLNRKVIQWSLKRLGVEFLHAKNGREAMDLLAERDDIHLVVLDLMMPVIDGFGVLEWLGGSERHADIPVVVNSALTDIDSVKRALSMGAYDYFLKPLSSDTLEVLLPTKAKNAMERSQLMREVRRRRDALQAELASAVRFQSSMLPKREDFLPLHIDYVYQPSSGVGGDFFDALRLDESRIALFIGDVTGHGLKAGMMSLMVKSVFRELIVRHPDPATLVHRMNRTLLSVFELGHYITGVYALFDLKRGTMTYANCGHPSPVRRMADGSTELLPGSGNFLGMLDDIQVDINEAPLTHGTRLLLFTDGVSEATDGEGRDLEVEGLCRAFGETDVNAEEPSRDLCDKVVAWQGSNEFRDDVLLVTCWLDGEAVAMAG